MDAHVVELLDGVCTLNGDRTGIDIGVVVLTSTRSGAGAVAVHVGHRSGRQTSGIVSVRLAARTGLNVLKEPLDEHRHLFTGDVVIRSEGGSSLAV